MNENTEILKRMQTLDERTQKELQKGVSERDWARVEVCSRVAHELGETLTANKRACERWESALARTGKTPTVRRRRTATNKPNFLDKKPAGFALNDKEYPAFAWAELLVKLCNSMRAKHQSAFDEMALQYQGRKAVYFQPKTGKGLRNPHKLDGEPVLFVETGFNANTIVRHCFGLLRRIEPDADLRIILQ